MAKTYEQLLAEAPDHMSDEFLQYLRDNNVVVTEVSHWLIIENCKYHTKERPYYTAFFKPALDILTIADLKELGHAVFNMDMLIKASARRTVKRFHVHLIKS